jgi:prophage maintenance system killer protein
MRNDTLAPPELSLAQGLDASMWYPSLPYILEVHERICASMGKRAKVQSMDVIEEAMLAPQRLSASAADGPTMARNAVALMRPLIQEGAFAACNERTAFALAQVFLHQNGFGIQASRHEFERFFLRLVSHSVTEEELASWLAPRVQSRWSERRLARIFGALNRVAELAEDLQEMPGLHVEVERLDESGFTLAQEIANFARLDEAERQEVLERFPALSAMWEEAF